MFLINGEAGNEVLVTDRGLHYGDGLFETLKIKKGAILYWEHHMARLLSGCERLCIPLPDIVLLRSEAERLISEYGNNSDAILKIIVTRGSGQRGYKPTTAAKPTRIIALYPSPRYPENYWKDGVRVTICKTRLAGNPRLARIKHLNRLEQILASSEWDDPAIVDGIMLDMDQHVIEGTMSNLFWVYEGNLYTPDLTQCGVEGIMRHLVLKLAEELQLMVVNGHYFVEDLLSADEIFITNSIHGIWPVRQIDQHTFKPGPVTKHLMDLIQ
ncbi:MAG: aminodeoxychorismate lyase [Gammaproteobacteria bacterium]|nr:aminodeoxychorismate lyase [Gammaproteobacteria bacterium]